jgi:hypothetical protein
MTWGAAPVGDQSSWEVPVWSSRLQRDGTWSEPAQMPSPEIGLFFMALGAEGRAVAVWHEEDPAGLAEAVVTSRFDIATGWSAPEALYEGPSGDPKVALDSRGYATVAFSASGEIRASRWACRPGAE